MTVRSSPSLSVAAQAAVQRYREQMREAQRNGVLSERQVGELDELLVRSAASGDFSAYDQRFETLSSVVGASRGRAGSPDASHRQLAAALLDSSLEEARRKVEEPLSTGRREEAARFLAQLGSSLVREG